MTQLLLSGSMHLLDVVVDLLQRRAVGHRLQDRRHAQLRVGGKVRHPAIGLAHQHHADHPTHRFVGRQEGLVLLDHQLAVDREQPGLPAALLRGALGQVDPVLAVLRRPAATALLTGIDHLRQRPQSGIAPQPADQRHARSQQPLQERPLGVGPVGHYPDRRVIGPQLLDQPLDLGGGQLQLRLEPPAVVGRHPADILGPDIQVRDDRQADGPPERVSDQPGQRDPDVAVEKLRPGWAWGGVVMLAGTLDLGPVPLGGRVVDGEDQRRTRLLAREPLHQDAKQGAGNGWGLATDAAEQVVITLVVAPHGAAAEPTGDGASAAGEEQPRAESDEPDLLAGVERPGQGGDPDDERDWQALRLHPRLSFA